MPLTQSQRTAVTTRFQTWLDANRPGHPTTAAQYVAYLDFLRTLRLATGQSVRGRWDAWYGGLRSTLTAAQRTACEAHIDGN